MSSKDEELKYSLNKLFMMFNDKPNILIEYFIKYDALKEEFVDRIINSNKLNDSSEEKPFFKNVTEMKQYYNEKFEDTPQEKVNELEILNKQLEQAIEKEDYEKAAKIRDYIKKIGLS